MLDSKKLNKYEYSNLFEYEKNEYLDIKILIPGRH